MLRNVSPLLTASLLQVLRSMGHGDELAIVDINFPAASTALATASGTIISLSGCTSTEAGDAILSVLPLDGFVECPVTRMEVVNAPEEVTEVQVEFAKLVEKHNPTVPHVMSGCERMAFYEKVKGCYAIVQTSERRPYGNFILKKGVIGPDGKDLVPSSKKLLPPTPSDNDHHGSSLRNRGPIVGALMTILPPTDSFHGPALEVASSTGAHLEIFADAFPKLIFQPSEFVPEVTVSADDQWVKYGKIGSRWEGNELACLNAHGKERFANVLPAVALDLLQPWDKWPASVREQEGKHVLIFACNTLHVTPWECSVGLLSNGAKALCPGGHLCIYGPFKVDGKCIGSDGGAANAAFDTKLQSTNRLWGLRDVGDLVDLGAEAGLELKHQIRLPSNNFLLHFVKK